MSVNYNKNISKLYIPLLDSKLLAIAKPTHNTMLGKIFETNLSNQTKKKQHQKTLKSTFAYFLTTFTKVLLLDGRLDAELCLQPTLIFLIFFMSQDPKS